jgi:transglutaminase-like putative cysteine protease
MKLARKLLNLASFLLLAAVAGLAMARVAYESEAASFFLAALAASLAGAPGLFRRRAWWVSLFLLPLGGVLLVRLESAPPATVHGIGSQAGFYVDQLRSGLSTYGAQRFPFHLAGAPDLALLLTLAVYAASGLAAFLALGLRRPLPGIAIALALVGFGLTVDGAERVVWLPLLFVVLAACTLMLSRSLTRRRWRVGDAASGVAVAAIAALLALSLLQVRPVSATTPLVDWTVWGVPGGSPRVSFDWMTDYPRMLDPQKDLPVMQVKSPAASYWRANALDQFDGKTWSSDSTGGVPLTGGPTYAVRDEEPQPAGRTVKETFDIRDLETTFFFVGGRARSITLGAPAFVAVTGVQALKQFSPLDAGSHYAASVFLPELKASDLVGQGSVYSFTVMHSRSLPFPRIVDLRGHDAGRQWRDLMSWGARLEWLPLYRLNRRIVGKASDPYEITLRIEGFLRADYRYSLTPPKTDYASPYAAFLFKTKTGYCQHFAGAMAVLLRFNGIPARVAQGFTTGTEISQGTYLVSRNDAHAWVEVYFPRAGWIPFDPTPGNTLPGRGPSSANAVFRDPFAPGQASGSTPPPTPTASPTRHTPARSNETGGAGAPASTSRERLLWLLVPAGALALWPAGRVAATKRRLRRGSLDERLGTVVNLVYADLDEFGVGAPPSWTLQETGRFLGEYLGLDATTVVRRVDALVFGGRSTTPQDLSDLARLRRQVRRRLRTRAGWMKAVLVSYGLHVTAR